MVESCRGDFDHLLLASSVPFFLTPGLHLIEAWNEAVADGAWGNAAPPWRAHPPRSGDGSLGRIPALLLPLQDLLESLVQGRLRHAAPLRRSCSPATSITATWRRSAFRPGFAGRASSDRGGRLLAGGLLWVAETARAEGATCDRLRDLAGRGALARALARSAGVDGRAGSDGGMSMAPPTTTRSPRSRRPPTRPRL